MTSTYRGLTIEIKPNVLSLWDVYINNILQDSAFLYDFNAMDYAKSLIRLGLEKRA